MIHTQGRALREMRAELMNRCMDYDNEKINDDITWVLKDKTIQQRGNHEVRFQEHNHPQNILKKTNYGSRK